MGIIAQMRNNRQLNNAQQTRVKQVISAKYTAATQSLNLNLCRDCWQQVLKKRSWVNLKHLHLQYCAININVVLNIQWPNLEELQISGNIFQIQQVNNFVRKKWNKLQTLGLNNCRIDNETLSILVDKRLKLKQLLIGSNKLNWKGMQSLMKMDTSNMQSLSLFKNCMKAVGAKLFSKIDFCQLTYLTLGNCDLDNEGLKHISKSKCPNLNTLAIGNNNLTIVGYQCIYLGDWSKLTKIQIGKFNQNNYMHQNKPLEFCALLPISAKKLQFQGSKIIAKSLRNHFSAMLNSRFQ